MSHHPHENDPPQTTRREFAGTLALFGAAAFVSGESSAVADEPAVKARLNPTEALLEIVRGRYGKHLSEEQLTAVQGRIARNLAAAERLKQIKLNNGDEPSFVFHASVPGTK
jgi:hypothetical protein